MIYFVVILLEVISKDRTSPSNVTKPVPFYIFLSGLHTWCHQGPFCPSYFLITIVTFKFPNQFHS